MNPSNIKMNNGNDQREKTFRSRLNSLILNKRYERTMAATPVQDYCIIF